MTYSFQSIVEHQESEAQQKQTDIEVLKKKLKAITASDREKESKTRLFGERDADKILDTLHLFN